MNMIAYGEKVSYFWKKREGRNNWREKGGLKPSDRSPLPLASPFFVGGKEPSRHSPLNKGEQREDRIDFSH